MLQFCGALEDEVLVGVVAAGLAVPLIIYLCGNNPALTAVKAVLILVGCACFRCVFLQAAVRRSLPGEENEWMNVQEEAELGLRLEQRWKEKEAWLYGETGERFEGQD